MSTVQDYPLGYSELEARRLAEQGALLEDLTVDVFRRAGLREGMTVLDIGCGVGDVTLLAARLVGPKGAVLGIDRAASSVQAARGPAPPLWVSPTRASSKPILRASRAIKLSTHSSADSSCSICRIPEALLSACRNTCGPVGSSPFRNST
jgi:SAM-dependent methyltransferase